MYKKGLVATIYKECSKLNSHKTKNPIRKFAGNMKRHFTEEGTEMANKHMKR